MIITNMYEAKTHLSKLIKKALQGEEVILAKSGKPLVKLVPAKAEKKDIKFGLMKGKIQMSEDFSDFGPEIRKIFKEYT